MGVLQTKKIFYKRNCEQKKKEPTNQTNKQKNELFPLQG